MPIPPANIAATVGAFWFVWFRLGTDGDVVMFFYVRCRSNAKLQGPEEEVVVDIVVSMYSHQRPRPALEASDRFGVAMYVYVLR